ncbi:hypothetical protein HU200_045941 [Digitaria exilis]|uniref:DUF6598 domain-containing protein n=1 Tax=Digitaria exilis TaxID=1010633 RepID=A0A835AYN9_9POAL|nr:hypothetical protein HU200_045941 [Digitaria exilis]
MEGAEQWEDVKARSEASRRRVVAEEQSPEQSPEKVVDRPGAQDPIEVEDEDDVWDPFCLLEVDEAFRVRIGDRPAAEPDLKLAKEKELARQKYVAEEAKFYEQTCPDSDPCGISGYGFRKHWDAMYSRNYGPFEAITEICSMQFTDEPAPPGTTPCQTVQVFSAKVTGLEGGLQWPLDVYGFVAIRDTVDRRRNIIFDRKRDSCQTLTKKDPYLVLTGPTRAVVLMDPITIEVKLLVKSTDESKDKLLSYLGVEPYIHGGTLYSELLNKNYRSELSTLEFTLGNIMSSVEATIFLQVTDGSWPDGFSCRFVTRTVSIDQEMVLLLHSGDKTVPCTDDGSLKLLRRVATVEVNGKLHISVKAWKFDNSGKNKHELTMPKETDEDDLEKGGVHEPTLADISVEKEVVFTPKKTGRSDDTLDIGFCKIKVTVAWSLIWRNLF